MLFRSDAQVEPAGDDRDLIAQLEDAAEGGLQSKLPPPVTVKVEAPAAAPAPASAGEGDENGRWDADQGRYLRPGEVSLAALEASLAVIPREEGLTRAPVADDLQILERATRDSDVRSMARTPEAIRRLSTGPAGVLGLDDRGEIAVGKRADLVLIDPARYVDTATYDEPHQGPPGVELVTVGGTAVWDNGSHTGARPGAVSGAQSRIDRAGDHR